jgi:hypothetical protein
MPNLVLRYAARKINSGTLRRHYLAWRKAHGLDERCDTPGCQFNHAPPLIWNGKPLPLTLDHINGVNSDNRPKNLRLLCPACNAQLPTQGGKNRGRVVKSSGGFALVDKETKLRTYVLPAEPGHFTITGGSA